MTSSPKPRKIETEGVTINIKWEKLIPGSSFFVPCIDTARLIAQIVTTAQTKGFKVVTRTRAENGRWGIRVWRIL
jgi:hypothetical protein